MTAELRWKAVRIAATSIYLLAAWLLLTGTIDARSLLAGAGISLAVSCATYDLFFHQGEAHRSILFPRIHLLLLFLLVVLFKMYVASFEVMADMIRGRINPRIVHFRTRLKSDLARVALANAITLIPGTITLLLDDDHLVVHWLNARTTHSGYAGKLIMGRLERLLGRIWM